MNAPLTTIFRDLSDHYEDYDPRTVVGAIISAKKDDPGLDEFFESISTGDDPQFTRVLAASPLIGVSKKAILTLINNKDSDVHLALAINPAMQQFPDLYQELMKTGGESLKARIEELKAIAQGFAAEPATQ